MRIFEIIKLKQDAKKELEYLRKIMLKYLENHNPLLIKNQSVKVFFEDGREYFEIIVTGEEINSYGFGSSQKLKIRVSTDKRTYTGSFLDINTLNEIDLIILNFLKKVGD